MKEQLAAGLSEGQITEFVENDEVHAREIFGQPPLPAGAGFGLQPIEVERQRIVDDPNTAASCSCRKSFEMLIAALYRPCLVRQKPQGGDQALEKVQGLRTLW
jgi:hypothetical protein